MYGGRVTDAYDRRVLVTFLDEYMGDFLFDDNQPFYFTQGSDEYRSRFQVPRVGGREVSFCLNLSVD